MPYTMTMPETQSCIEACLQCFKEREYCGTQCLGIAEMAACTKTCFDCAAPCTACVTLMAHESPLHGKMCGLCAEACAAECAKHDVQHCRDCVQACCRCAEECERMAQMMA